MAAESNISDWDNCEFQVQLIGEGAKVPTRAHDGDVGYDLYSIEDKFITIGGRVITVKTGIAITPPEGYYAQIRDKSGLFTKYGIKTGAGVIDQEYTGDITVALICFGGLKTEEETGYQIKKGDKIAQLVFYKICKPKPKIVEELKKTNRGSKGFGSTETK